MRSQKELKSLDRAGGIYPDPRCRNCLETLVGNISQMVGGKAIEFKEHIRSETRRILEHGAKRGWASPECINEILRTIRSVSGVSDPYEAVKRTEMRQAESVFMKVKDLIEDDLRSLANLAVLGNSIDFFRSPEEAMAEVTEHAGKDLCYFQDDLDRLEDFLVNDPGTILYLTDNAGEVFFDLPLFAYMQKFARRAVLVVKGGPGLNDLTPMEVKSMGDCGIFGKTKNTGIDGVGIDWRHVSSEFKLMFDEADLVLSKGMANFETLYFHDLKTPVLFLFRTKCQPIAEYFQAPLNSFMALWKA